VRLGTEVRRNWLRPKVVLRLLGAPASLSVGGYLSWLVTDGWQDSSVSVLRLVLIIVAVFGLISVGLIATTIKYIKDKY